MPFTLGYFVFKNIGDGCLVSKYGNDSLKSPLTESAKLISGELPNDLFTGTYRTTWIENEYYQTVSNNISDQSLLEIEKRPDGIYILKWYERSVVFFIGEGMIFEDLLIGAYSKIVDIKKSA